MTHEEIVRKLIGEIQPVGECYEDAERYSNLKNLITLVDCLISDLEAVATDVDRYESSRKEAGILAKGFLDDLFDTLSEGNERGH